MSRNNCRSLAKQLKNFLNKENVEMIENLSKETKGHGKEDRPIKTRERSVLKRREDRSLDRYMSFAPKNRNSKLRSLIRNGFIGIIVPLFFVTAYIFGVIDGFTGERYPFSWLINYYPKIYY
ncbi:uncharacterized protein LOC116347650 [Contarinia nasturtii]|uniref:uncharacterized protein LOC116347650 n=1 Tax=Contarinia nasturtii TaxID=265458 RepID=UPI0012D37406|nr:uncharacterized protein LOC116347650 [Contarinia nasturtii]